jgi:acyl dehydratase
MIDGYRYDTVPAFVGRELGLSRWLEVGQDRIQAFADCAEDAQWIHLDVERCRRESPFGAPIAHGFLTLALLTPFLNDIGVVPADVSRAINSGLNNVRFRAPVPAGSRVRGRIRLTDAQPKGDNRCLITVSAVVEVENQTDPAMTADMVIMLFR